jgi:Undecaprenyl-phosphate galactose phosphotransferase WbaP
MRTNTFAIPKDVDIHQQNVGLRHYIFNTYSRAWMGGMLCLADLLSMALAVYLGFYIRMVPELIINQEYLQLLVALVITVVLAFSRTELYPATGVDRIEELRQIVSSTSFSFLLLIAFTFLFKTTSTYSRLALLYTWGLCLVLIPLGRFLVRRVLIRLQLWGEPVAIIGDLDKALPLADYFRRKPQLGIRPAAVLRDELSSHEDFSAYPPRTVEEIREYARSLSLQTVMLVVRDLNYVDSFVDRYRFVFQRVILIKHKRGKFGLNTLKTMDFSDVLGLQVRHNLLNPWSQVLKRTVDILGSFFGLILISPFLGAVALMIKLESAGGVFYRQPRLGKNGRVFNMLKFRTMFANSDHILLEKLESDPALKREFDQYQKLKDDPRITRMGKLLRKFSLDELPQLWNALLGEMSLVGPRPIMLNQEKMYGAMYNDYVKVAPGMTGLWQISGRNLTTFRRRAELDNEYIQRWSLWMDIYILLATVRVVLFRDGAF